MQNHIKSLKEKVQRYGKKKEKKEKQINKNVIRYWIWHQQQKNKQKKIKQIKNQNQKKTDAVFQLSRNSEFLTLTGFIFLKLLKSYFLKTEFQSISIFILENNVNALRKAAFCNYISRCSKKC